MSEEKCPVKVIRNVLIPMRDGVKLAADITRPAAEGRFPAIMAYLPYHKPGAAARSSANPYFAERGYVVVNFDARGTGDSEGSSADLYDEEEMKDGYDMVEWIARQPWCNGNVGMWGLSFSAIACWQVAMQAPPHLKGIIVRSGCDDVYTEFAYPGGSPRPFVFDTYAPQMTAMNCQPPNIELCGERWAEIWDQHLQHNVPWGIGFIKHQLDGPYWRDRSVRPDYDRIKCAVFVVGGWNDWYPTPLLRAFANLKVPKKALVGPWSHQWPDGGIPGPRFDDLPMCLRWFDQWLKGVDTGIIEEPSVTVFVRKHTKPQDSLVTMENGSWRSEEEWPLARAEDAPMYLRAAGELSREPCAEDEVGCDSNRYDPAVGAATGRQAGGAHGPWGLHVDQRPDEVSSLTYTTSPLEEDLEVTGHPCAVLHVSSTAKVAAVSVKLCDVAPDGVSTMVTQGYLNATHRDSHTDPTLLEPGKVYELRIDLLALAYVFEAGHSIRLDIAGADFPNAWPTPELCVSSFHRGGEYASRVILPVIPAQSPKLPEPELPPAKNPIPPRATLLASRPQITVTRDIINGMTTVDHNSAGGHASFTVSSRNPAEAVAKGTMERVVKHPGAEIRVRSQCITTSNRTSFRHLVEVEVTVNGRPHFSKSWSVSVPREFS